MKAPATKPRLRRPFTTPHRARVGFETTYSSWRSMMSRCTREDCGSYARYGAKGVSVCDRWTRFVDFLSDMGARPEGCTLDRIDNERGYDPGNGRWATPAQQFRNSSRFRPTPVGTRFGRLTTIAECEVVGSGKKRRTFVRCRCDCGGEVYAHTYHLRNGHTQSCGCLWRERFIKRKEAK